MFYPVESLKRGGRFYLCWVADSWPLRFATLTHRQLWSQDIRKICDDLLEVMTNESGRPAKRFSLRLSSQLLRGLVRLYQRKVTVFLSELCMINANVIKHSNKKWHIHEVEEEVQPKLQQLDAPAVHEIVDNVQRVEELIQNSGNVVNNIQDITLKETAIPAVLLPPNDGFGEEHPEQPLQLLQDRTLEMMLQQSETSAVQHSGLGAALEADKSYNKSHDKSRLAPHDSAQMETIEEHDMTLFRKSTGAELVADFEKDIPEIPEIPPPDLPVPPPDKPQAEEPKSPGPSKQVPIPEVIEQELVDIELEELQDEPQSKRRRLKNKLIVDKKTKLSPNFLRARINNPLVELRCEDSSEDIIFIRVPPEVYFRRPCHGGDKIASNIGYNIAQLFMRNLGVVNVKPRVEREMESARPRSHRTRMESMLDKIDEVQEPAQEVQIPQPVDIEPPADISITKELLIEPQRVSAVDQMELDIADMPTQKIETLSQQARKRTAEQQDTYVSPKVPRVGYISYKESKLSGDISTRVAVAALEADKENIPDNVPPPKDAEKIISSMLQEAGLADIQIHQPMDIEHVPSIQEKRDTKKTGSEGSETPLGSLDRTKVSLGDSDQTTDSKRFIRDQWGTEGTMIKILKLIKAGLQPVTVGSLIAKGPVISGYKRVIVARCFNSILKLKQHGFINIFKDSDTLEIRDVTLGPRLINSSEHF